MLDFYKFPAVWLFVYHFVYSSNLAYGDSVYDDILHKAQLPLVTFTPREHILLTLSRVQCIAYPFAMCAEAAAWMNIAGVEVLVLL